MIETPCIIQSTQQATAFIRVTVPRSEIRNVMGPGLAELMSTIASQGIAPTGPWFSHHLKMDSKIFDVKISIPVSTPVAPSGRVQAGILPAAKVARTVYHGSYEHLGKAWEEFMVWIASEGLTPKDDSWESYKIGPADTLNPGSWHTELNRPLVD